MVSSTLRAEEPPSLGAAYGPVIASNPAFSPAILTRFEISRSWVQSVYVQMSLMNRAGTTSRLPEPEESIMNVNTIFLVIFNTKWNYIPFHPN